MPKAGHPREPNATPLAREEAAELLLEYCRYCAHICNNQAVFEIKGYGRGQYDVAAAIPQRMPVKLKAKIDEVSPYVEDRFVVLFTVRVPAAASVVEKLRNNILSHEGFLAWEAQSKTTKNEAACKDGLGFQSATLDTKAAAVSVGPQVNQLNTLTDTKPRKR